MINELPQQVQKEIRILRQLKDGNGIYSSIEERDGVMDKLIHHISDIVLSILIREDKEKQELFLKN